MKMFLNSEWVDRSETIDVLNPYDGSVVDTVPKGTGDDVDKAVEGLKAGAETMRKMTAYRRFEILQTATQIMRERKEDLAQTLSKEEGKTIKEARGEIDRSSQTMELSAEEAKRIYGEVLPLDAASHGAGKFGFTLRIPCGIVGAISPFNFPLNLVTHKVGPAIAAGNAVLLKPASDTPLIAMKLVEILLEAGLPTEAIAIITGSGKEIGKAICTNPHIRKITFTGSREVGEAICKMAGLKKVTMELGSNCPLVVMPDADLDKVAKLTVATGFANAGQVCISAQRILVDKSVYDEYLERLEKETQQVKAGNQLLEESGMGPMVRESDAVRVAEWIDEAVSGGARKLCGGERQGALLTPTVLADVKPEMKVSYDEVFGPTVAVSHTSDIEEAIRSASNTNYGLSAAIFTQDIDRALKFAREVPSGNIHINWGTAWRADLMPYGGLKDSGLGKEGPKYAIEEMTESKTVVIHGKD
ncbi:NAD-dependent aldehyde dehydrogenase [Planctomycetales bacterium 10988]|nr:NAD-dependent aldehyde dehydrogenase [Planctomycetales bacterium 10988]